MDDAMQAELLALLDGRRGHFQMESGYHSDAWFELDRLFDRRERLTPFVGELAARLTQHGIEAICGPMTGGAKLAEMIGAEVGVPAFGAERIALPDTGGLFPIKYQLSTVARARVRGRRVAIVDDAISAGSAVRGTLADLVECGARPVAIGALIIFGDAADKFAREHALALEAVARTSFAMWKPGECPLCQAGVALEKVSDAPL
jgi:orotate phosphoribosyltransferase